jgi:hypothetical protein
MNPVKINKQLNLVLPITRADDSQIYVHSTPFGEEVWDAHYEIIAVTMNALYTGGVGLFSPRIAHKKLRDVARERGRWDGPGGVQLGIVAEIHRLTNVLAPGTRGWEMVPYDEALKRGVIGSEEADVIEGAITFFTLAWRTHDPRVRQAIVEGASVMWGARSESLSCSEFLSSLPTSTTAASTGVRAVA